MAERKITLRRHNGGVAGTLADYDELYPTTTTDQLVSAADGTTQVFDTNHKLKEAYLPDSVFGGMKFVGSVSGTVNASTLYTTLKGATSDAQEIGAYFIATAAATITFDVDSTNSVTHTLNPQYGGNNSQEEGDDTSPVTIEAGDWFILVNKWSFSGTSFVAWSFVNNTYADATTAVKGVVTVSASTSVATTGSAVITDGILNGLMGTTSTKIAYGNHLHTGVYEPANTALTNLGTTMASLSTGTLVKTGVDTFGLNSDTYLSDSTSSTQNGYFGNIHLRDDSTPSHYLAITASSNLTANRTLSLATGDAARTLTFGGDITTTAGNLTINAQAAGSTLSLPSTLTVGAVTANGILYGSSADTVGMIASTTIGRNTLTIPDISAISFARYNVDESISLLSAADFRTAIGAGTSSTTGTVTSVATSGAITGGTITTTGTISHSTADGNLHLPATSTTNNKKFLVAGSTAGSFAWETWPRVYYDTLPTTAQTGDIYIDID